MKCPRCVFGSENIWQHRGTLLALGMALEMAFEIALQGLGLDGGGASASGEHEHEPIGGQMGAWINSFYFTVRRVAERLAARLYLVYMRIPTRGSPGSDVLSTVQLEGSPV
jgi:hypothetical protein